ncbi:MAG TPA: HigA family addiction module antitoxin [Pyrinomonadaceae bacterium]
MLNGRKRRPTHPGEVLREDVIPALNITQGEFARTLGVSRRTVNEILQEKRPVTVDTAHRLACALGTSPKWLGLQQDVDLWDALETNGAEYERIKPLRAT